MIPERWQQVKKLFHAAIDREPSGRAVFLDAACSGNIALREEVESLLESYEKTGDFMDAPAYELAADLLVEQESSMTPGETIGSYRLISVLGRGGMGEVYLAEDARLGRRVALKFLPASYSTDAERLRRFEREARAASALNHPNILTVYEVGVFEGRQFIATEYVEGETLRQRQMRDRLKVSEVLDLSIQVGAALAAAHQAGIVHRDVKPENIMLRRDGYVKVVDFGLAKLTETVQAATDTSVSTMLQVDTDTGVVMGTTAYMSPEQARGLSLDARTDIWSLGVVLYELLSGAMPFKGNTQSDLIVSILERDPSPLVTAPLVPSELGWIVRKALRKDREERYQTARELLSDLRGVKQQLEFAAQLERSGVPDAASSDDAHLSPLPGTPAPGAATESLRPVTTDQTAQAESSRHSLGFAGRERSLRLPLMLAFGVVLLLAAVAAYKYWPRADSTVPFQSMAITRITNSGKAIDATLSPDGKYLIYALSDAGKQSLWVRQVSTANDKEIVPAAPVGFFGLAFSPDGNDLYYAVKANLDAGTLYRIPTLGGTPVKILQGIDGPISFSPDGKQLTLVRGNFPSTGESALVIASIDGSNERTLAVKKSPEMFAPIFFTGPSWSPDGKLIATTVAQRGGSSHIVAFAVADGKESDLSPEPWRFAARVMWLPDMSGLLVIAGDIPGATQVWLLSYPDGKKRRITNDLNVYRSLGLSADGRKLSTVQTGGLVNIWIAPEGDAKQAVQLPTGNIGFFASAGNTLSWTKDGRIVFVSNESGNIDLWIMDANGSNRRQLTSNAGYNANPVVSHDGRFIVFQSGRSGTRSIWRMEVDGSNPRQLTSGPVDGLPALSPDDKWIFYTSLTAAKPTLWKISVDGGTPQEITNHVAVAPSVSPDGKFVSFMYPESRDPLAPPNRIAVISVDGGEPVKTFSFQASGTITPYAQWATDGKSILYNVSDNNVTNIWSQPLDGGPPKQVTDFKDSLMSGYSWSHDGKTLASTRGLLLRDAVLLTDVR